MVRNDDNQNGVADANPTDKTLDVSEGAVWSDGIRLAVVDQDNHRVLLWNSFPTQNFQPANLVLGQNNFTGGQPNAGGGVSASTLSYPIGIHSNGTQLAVADTENSRVLIWNTFPTQNAQAADRVLGQADLNSALNLPDDSRSIDYPVGVLFYQDKLLVVDGHGTDRILIFAAQ